MVNKSSKILSLLALLLCFTLLFCACSETVSDENGGETNPPATETPNPDDNPTDENPGDNTDPGNENDGKITYTVNVKDYDGNPVPGVEVQFCVGELCQAPVYSDASGVATITLVPDNYHVKINPGVYAGDPAEYEFDEGSTTLDATVYKLPTGAEDDPIPLEEGETQIKISAGAKLYYTVFMPGDKTITIADNYGKQAVVEYNGVTYNSQDGKVTVALEGGFMANIAISSADGKLALFNLKLESKAGSYTNPIVLEDLDPITVSVSEAGSVHYKWIASGAGTLTVSCANSVSDITLTNITGEIYGDASNGAPSVSINVNAGDEILIIFATVMDETTWICPAADLNVTFALS